MKKTAIAQAVLIVVLPICLLIVSNTIEAKTSFESINSLSFNANTSLKTIVYDASKGLSTDKFPEDLKQIDIFNNKGRKVLSINKFDNAIYLNALKRGSYSIRITTNKGDISKVRLIKQ